jgi:hypothetical protein
VPCRAVLCCAVLCCDKRLVRHPPCRQWLPAATWEGEAQLWKSLCKTSKVILTPGESCHAREPGFFRLCFAWMPPEAVEVAVGRLAKQLKGNSCNLM